jgi:hypothetical protein
MRLVNAYMLVNRVFGSFGVFDAVTLSLRNLSIDGHRCQNIKNVYSVK